jgi:hypothetical protein
MTVILDVIAIRFGEAISDLVNQILKESISCPRRDCFG